MRELALQRGVAVKEYLAEKQLPPGWLFLGAAKPGTIDADYRGEIKVIMINHGQEPFVINRGDRIAQLVIAPVAIATIVETEELEESRRSDGGFGHTGT